MLLGFRRKARGRQAVIEEKRVRRSHAVLGQQHDRQGDLWRSEALSVRKTTLRKGIERGRKKEKVSFFGIIPKSSP